MRRVALRFASRRPSLATSGRRLLCSKTPSDSEPVSVPFLRRVGAPEGGEKGGEKGGEEGESLIRFGDDEESEDGEAEPKSTAEPGATYRDASATWTQTRVPPSAKNSTPSASSTSVVSGASIA